MLSKMKAGGTFDPSFGIAGHSIKSVKNNDGNYTYSSSAVQENGSVISTITTRDTLNLTYTESVFRVDAQGQIDPTFNVNIGIPDIFPVKTKIIVSGNLFYYFRKSDNQTGYSFDVIHCYDLNGLPVSAFGNNGIALINQNDIPASATSFAAVDDNGDLLISSGTPDPAISDNFLFLTAQIKGADNNVAINDPMALNEFSAYPNPTSGPIFFKGFTGSAGSVLAEVKNSLGQTVFSKPGFSLNESMDLTGKAKGLYFIQITDGNNMKTIKLLKQ
jgi:hypothetical protein